MGMLQAGIIPVTPFQQNCTILFDPDTKEGVVVDPGGDVSLIVGAIEEHGLKIKEIWLTHGHLDHAGGAKELKEKLGIDIVGPHEDDLPLLQRIETQAEKYGVQGLQNVTPDRWLKDGDKVSFGSHEFEVYHTPGHAPGHVIYFNRAQNLPISATCSSTARSAAPTCRAAIIASFSIPSETRCCRSATTSASSADTAPAAASVTNAVKTPSCGRSKHETHGLAERAALLRGP